MTIQLLRLMARYGLQAVIALLLLMAVWAASASGQEQAPAGFQAYSLRHVAAHEVAAELRKALPGTAKILVDAQGNRVLIEQSLEANRIAAELIPRLDRPAPAANEGPVGRNEPFVREFIVEPERLERIAAELRSDYSNEEGVRVVTNPRSGQLLVLAPPDLQKEITQRLGQVGIRAVAGRDRLVNDTAADEPLVRRGYQLQNITWRELEDNLHQVWGSRVSVMPDGTGQLANVRFASDSRQPASLQIDRRRNYVSVESPEGQLQNWSQLIQALDVAPTTATRQTAVMQLLQADPQKVDRAVGLLNALRRNEALKNSNVEVKMDQAEASRRWGGHLIATIFQPNGQEGAQGQPDGQAQPVDNGQPPDGQQPPDVPGGDGVPGEGEQESTGLRGEVQIEILEGIGALIIRGDPRDVALVKKVIEDIIAASRLTEPEVQVYPLRYVESRALSTLLAQIYEEVFAPRQGPVSITPLVKPNALLLIGQPDSVKSVVSVIRQLDRPVPPSTQFEVFRLRYMSAIDAATRINEFYTAQQTIGQAQQGQPAVLGLAPRVVAIPDYRSNSVIVQASPRDMDEVRRMIRKIDVQENMTLHEVRIFKLTNTLATELAPVLQDAINGQLTGAGRSTTGQQQLGIAAAAPGQAQTAQLASPTLQFMTIDPEGGRLIKSGVVFDVRVVADVNSNALIVTGPAETMELIAALIKQLDQLPSAEAQIKVFTIINGDATNLAIMLQQLFGQQVTAGQGGFGQAAFIQALNQTQLATASGEGSLVPLRFAVDLRTNSIIATGSLGDLNVVEAILARLDIGGIESRRTTVYRLMNAPAIDVSNALTDLLTRQAQLQQSALTGIISPFEQFEREVLVVPEQVSNSLIISATPRFYDQIIEVVKELDQRPPMVMIQVLIAQVQLGNIREFGIEAGIQDSLWFDRGIANMIGFPFNQAGIGNGFDATSLNTRETIAGQGLANLNVGRINGNLQYGGLVLQAGNESITALLRALQDQRRVRVLSRPQIMTLDNWQAFVQIGQLVPRITGSGVNQFGTTTNQVSDVQTGVIMRVTPRITPDGQVTMFLDVEKSAVGDINDGIPVAVDPNGSPVLSPRIDTTTASTTLTARSGQTVVFAGLLEKSTTNITRGVPWLSDLPGIGRLFRFDSQSEQQSELLIVMTPYIIKDDQDYQWILRKEASRINWVWGDVVDMHNDMGIGMFYDDCGCPITTEVIFPDLDPTGDQLVPMPAGPLGLEESTGMDPADRSSRRRRLSNLQKRQDEASKEEEEFVIEPVTHADFVSHADFEASSATRVTYEPPAGTPPGAVQQIPMRWVEPTSAPPPASSPYGGFNPYQQPSGEAPNAYPYRSANGYNVPPPNYYPPPTRLPTVPEEVRR